MEEFIIKKDDYTITRRNTKTTLFTIRFDCYNEPLIRSFVKTNILLGTTISDHYKTVIFNAVTVKTLTQLTQESNQSHNSKQPHKSKKAVITYETIGKMIYHLSCQLKFLIENYNMCFVGYSPDNIIIIDDTHFVYIPNTEQLCEIEEEHITIAYPFSPHDFYQSPETYSIKEIPSKIHYKSIYYSLASLIVDYLYKNRHVYDDDVETENVYSVIHSKINPRTILEKLPIVGTKLYYLLKRCLVTEVKNRSLLYI
jgi:hypothetical protein